jgi:hypothetical protein
MLFTGAVFNCYKAAAYQDVPINGLSTICASDAVASTISPTLVGLPIPSNLILPAQGEIQGLVLNLDVNDQWNVAQLQVEEWLDNV